MLDLSQIVHPQPEFRRVLDVPRLAVETVCSWDPWPTCAGRSAAATGSHTEIAPSALRFSSMMSISSRSMATGSVPNFICLG